MTQLNIFDVEPKINEFQIERATVRDYSSFAKYACVLGEIPKRIKVPYEGKKWGETYEEWESYVLAIWRYQKKKGQCSWEEACELFKVYRDGRIPAPLLVTIKHSIEFKPEVVIRYLEG